MADLGEEFNVADMDTADDLLPVGHYILQGVDNKIRDTKGGKMATIQFQVLDGAFENRRIFVNYNYRHENAEAQRMGKRDIARLAAAVKITTFTDLDQLMNIPFVGKVGVQEDKKGQYDDQNTIGKYYTIEEHERAEQDEAARTKGGGEAPRRAPANQNAPANSPPPRAAATNSKKPWL